MIQEAPAPAVTTLPIAEMVEGVRQAMREFAPYIPVVRSAWPILAIMLRIPADAALRYREMLDQAPELEARMDRALSLAPEVLPAFLTWLERDRPDLAERIKAL